MTKRDSDKLDYAPNHAEFDDNATSAMADFLLLGLIRAYPSKKVDDERERLARAKLAIFGTPIAKGKRSYLDSMAMVHIAKGYINERGAPEYDHDYKMIWQDEANASFSSLTALAETAYLDLVELGRLQINTSTKEQLVRTWQKKFEANKSDWLRLGDGRDELAIGSLQSFIDDLSPILAKRGIKIADISDPFTVFNRPI